MAGRIRIVGCRLGRPVGGNQSVFLFHLEIGQTADRFGHQGRIGSFLQEALVARHRLVEPALDPLLADFDSAVAQLGDRPAGVDRRAGADVQQQQSRDEESCFDHGFTLFSPSALTARS